MNIIEQIIDLQQVLAFHRQAILKEIRYGTSEHGAGNDHLASMQEQLDALAVTLPEHIAGSPLESVRNRFKAYVRATNIFANRQNNIHELMWKDQYILLAEQIGNLLVEAYSNVAICEYNEED